MTTRKVFITSTTNDNDKLNIEMVIDIPEDIVHADIDYWAKKKDIELFYENHWTNTTYYRKDYEGNIRAITDALDKPDLKITYDLRAKLKDECKKVIRDHYGYTDIDGSDFNKLSLSDMIDYLASTGTKVEVYIMPKKRIKEVVK
jgi:formyltetrahydrofolate synthetase